MKHEEKSYQLFLRELDYYRKNTRFVFPNDKIAEETIRIYECEFVGSY